MCPLIVPPYVSAIFDRVDSSILSSRLTSFTVEFKTHPYGRKSNRLNAP